MKTLLLVLFLMTPVANAELCSDEPTNVQGVLLHSKCFCESQEYPELSNALEPLEAKVIPSAPGGTDVEGKTLYTCGYTLEWTQRPKEKTACMKTLAKAMMAVGEKGPKGAAINFVRFDCRSK